MTEEEWLECDNVHDLFECVRSTASTRKTRLLGCACVSWCWEWGLNEPVPEAVRAAEAFADGLATAKELRRVATELSEHLGEYDESYRPYPRTCQLTKTLVSRHDYRDIVSELHEFAYDMNILDEPEWRKMSAFLQDIFGNPFRKVNFNPAWRTSDVLLLAQGIYADRAFDRMPILADALQDAGCDNVDILNHCREPNATHVRGCWVVDLVLGKE